MYNLRELLGAKALTPLPEHYLVIWNRIFFCFDRWYTQAHEIVEIHHSLKGVNFVVYIM